MTLAVLQSGAASPVLPMVQLVEIESAEAHVGGGELAAGRLMATDLSVEAVEETSVM